MASVAAQAGGIGRMDPKGESRPDPRQGMDRMLESTGLQRAFSKTTANFRLQRFQIEPRQIEHLRQAAHRQSPEVEASLARILRNVLASPIESKNLSDVQSAAVEVIKARIEMPWASELQVDALDERQLPAKAWDETKTQALPYVSMQLIAVRIEQIRRAVGLPAQEVRRYSGRSEDVDTEIRNLEDLGRHTEAELADRIFVLRNVDPVATQFIEDIITICPYFAEHVE